MKTGRPRKLVLCPNRQLPAYLRRDLERKISYGGTGQPRKYPEAKVGDRFGLWTVIAYWLPDVEHHNARRVCVRCSCGVWRVHRENLLVTGKTKSCGHMLRASGILGGISQTRIARKQKQVEVEKVMAKVKAIEPRPVKELLEDRDNHRDASNSDADSSSTRRVLPVANPWHRTPWLG